MAANLKAFTMTATPLRGPTRYLRPPPHREGEWRHSSCKLFIGHNREARHGRAHRWTALLRDDGQERPGYSLRASKPDGPVVLDLPDGADVHLVSLHRYRSAGLREVAEGTRRAHHAGHRTGLLGGDRRCSGTRWTSAPSGRSSTTGPSG